MSDNLNIRKLRAKLGTRTNRRMNTKSRKPTKVRPRILLADLKNAARNP